MKKFLLALFAIVALTTNSFASDNEHININAGFLFPKSLNATVGFEYKTDNGHAYEIFAELGDEYKHPVCHNFWKGYYWDGGVQYKHQLKRFKNGNFRIFGGAQFGAVETKFFLGIRAGFEYNYIFANNWELSIQQLNTVNFIHGSTFRDGFMIGFKIPL